MTTTHAYLAEAPRQPGSRIVRDVALALMNYYCRENFSRSKWLKQKPRIINWSDNVADPKAKRHLSQSIDLRALEEHLERGRLESRSFGLFPPACEWLDSLVQVGPQFHYVDPEGKAVTLQTPTSLGAGFPLVPRLDREGMTFSSFQAPLQNRIIRLRTRLLERSHDFTTDEWFDDLRSLVGECICLIDSTLHQLYFKAQYSPRPGWKFEPARL